MAHRWMTSTSCSRMRRVRNWNLPPGGRHRRNGRRGRGQLVPLPPAVVCAHSRCCCLSVSLSNLLPECACIYKPCANEFLLSPEEILSDARVARRTKGTLHLRGTIVVRQRRSVEGQSRRGGSGFGGRSGSSLLFARGESLIAVSTAEWRKSSKSDDDPSQSLVDPGKRGENCGRELID
jgi:hypothetical protein